MIMTSLMSGQVIFIKNQIICHLYLPQPNTLTFYTLQQVFTKSNYSKTRDDPSGVPLQKL